MKIFAIEKIFKKLKLDVRSTSHNYGWLIVNGSKILRVHYSHGKGELPKKIIHKIRSQLKLNEKDFDALIRCPLSYENYICILEKKGFIR
jgi:hypothetical protein